MNTVRIYPEWQDSKADVLCDTIGVGTYVDANRVSLTMTVAGMDSDGQPGALTVSALLDPESARAYAAEIVKRADLVETARKDRQ